MEEKYQSTEHGIDLGRLHEFLRQCMKKLVLIIGICAVLSCTEQRGFRAALSQAQKVMEERPDSALAVLDTLGRHASEFDGHFRMQYLLARTYAQAKVGVLFTTDSLTSALVRHFDGNGTHTEKALAYYLYGCALSDIGQSPEALQAYYDAIERADTTKDDGSQYILRGIYGQMSRIFHEQNLPHDEIWAMQHYIDYTRRTSSEEEYVMAKHQMIRPYYLLGDTSTVLSIIDEGYHTLKRLGKDARAASSVSTAIYIYVERAQMDEARRLVDIFEQESGLFDADGNIAAGREGYYYTKGFYELAANHLDAAERNFRRAIHYGYLSEGYRGLLRVYRERGVMDSVMLFSERYEAAQDTLHNRMQTQTIHQMSSLYNYSRSQREAELAARKAREARLWLIGILVAVAFGLLLIRHVYKDYKKRKQAEIDRLKAALDAATQEYQRIKVELAAGQSSAVDNFADFEHSKMAAIFRKKKDFKVDNPLPTKAEWRALEAQFSKDMPAAYQMLAKDKKLSPLELHVCMLLILGFEDGTIANLADSMPQAVSNAKSRANKKIFGERGAQTLKAGLLQLINVA